MRCIPDNTRFPFAESVQEDITLCAGFGGPGAFGVGQQIYRERFHLHCHCLGFCFQRNVAVAVGRQVLHLTGDLGKW